MAVNRYHGVDFDGTLADHDFVWPGLGKPVPIMVARVKEWLTAGEAVRIVTARAGILEPEATDDQPYSAPFLDTDQIARIRAWCLEHVGVELPVQYWKCYRMIDLWDDRARQVLEDTGIAVMAPGPD